MVVSETNPAVATHAALIDARLAAPVANGDDEQHLWTSFDLAALAESRLGDTTDPRDVDSDRRSHWIRHAADAKILSPAERDAYGYRCMWLLHGDRNVGTVALSDHGFRDRRVTLSSLYVLPSHRGRGIATRALRTIVHHLRDHDVALNLHASWVSPRAIPLYLREGLWAHSFKDDIRFTRYPDDPPPLLDVGAETARLCVEHDGDRLTLCTATRHDDELVSFERPESAGDHLFIQAESTLALAIALHGWPLVRRSADWNGRWCGDAGSPEALASHILNIEAYSRHQGWHVDTPTIPGLPKPTWKQLQGDWTAR